MAGPMASCKPIIHATLFKFSVAAPAPRARSASILVQLIHRTMAIKHMHVDRTATSPEIELDLEQGTIEFTGRSLPANGELFYGRVYRWLDEYLKQPKEQTTVNMKLDYLDTSSSKHFYNIFDRLCSVNDNGLAVQVNWHYETGDEEMAEAGKDYESLFPMRFNFIEVKELF